MKGDLLINGSDAFAMGIAMGDGFLDALETPVPIKPLVENDDPTKDGKEVIVEDSAGRPVTKLQARDVTLAFVVFGDTVAERQQRYRDFLALLYKGKVTICVPPEGAEVYNLIYKSNSGQFNISASRKTCTVAVKFNEPNPANRK